MVQMWCGLALGVMIWTWLECVVQPTLFAFPLHQMHAQRATMLPSLYIVLHLPACTVRSGIAQCSIYPPSRPTLHQRHEQHTETSSAFVVHFAPCGTRLTLSQCTAEQEHCAPRCVCLISGCGRGILSPAFVWLAISTQYHPQMSTF